MFLIIDGSSMLSTNYYGTLPFEVLTAKTDEDKISSYSRIMQTSDGVYTNGVFTSVKQILKMIKYQKPEGIVVVFDKTRDTFRREIYPEYKGNRSDTPRPLKEQFETLEQFLEAVGIPVYFSDEYEADDFAGSIAKKLESYGKECVLMSGDKDYYQLVSPNTKLWRIVTGPQKAKYEKVYNIYFDDYTRHNNFPSGIFETCYGESILSDGIEIDLMPEQFVDFLAVVGDKADNIPGVDRVGPLTILPLLREYGSLEKLYDVIKKANADGTAKALAKEWKETLGVKSNPINALLAGEDKAKLSKKLALIKTDVDTIADNPQEYALNVDYDMFYSLAERYEMNSLLGDIMALKNV